MRGSSEERHFQNQMAAIATVATLKKDTFSAGIMGSSSRLTMMSDAINEIQSRRSAFLTESGLDKCNQPHSDRR